MNSQVLIDRELLECVVWQADGLLDELNGMLQYAGSTGEDRKHDHPHIDKLRELLATPAPIPDAGEGELDGWHGATTNESLVVRLLDMLASALPAVKYESKRGDDTGAAYKDLTCRIVSALQEDHIEDVRAMVVPDGLTVEDRSFIFVSSEITIPTLLLSFKHNDWDARDKFAALLAAAPETSGKDDA